MVVNDRTLYYTSGWFGILLIKYEINNKKREVNTLLGNHL